MKKIIRVLSVCLILVLLAGEWLSAYAAKSPGGNTDFPDNPFDIIITPKEPKPTPTPPPPRRRNSSSTEAPEPATTEAAETSAEAGAQGPVYEGPGGPNAAEENLYQEPNRNASGNDFIAKTTKYANGIIEASTVKPSDGLKYKLIITPFAQYPTIPDLPSRELCPVAFADITSAPVLSDYLPIIKPKAIEAGAAPESCYPYQLFDMTYYRDYGSYLEKSDNFGTVSISLPDYVLDRFVCLLHYEGGAWQVVENAYVIPDKGWLRFTADSLSPFAIIIHDGQAATGVKSPQTGYDFITEFYFTVKEWMRDLFER